MSEKWREEEDERIRVAPTLIVFLSITLEKLDKSIKFYVMQKFIADIILTLKENAIYIDSIIETTILTIYIVFTIQKKWAIKMLTKTHELVKNIQNVFDRKGPLFQYEIL